MAETEPEDFSDAPERMSELYRAITAGDVGASMDAIQEATTLTLTYDQKWGIITIGILYALASLMRRVQPVVQPIADAAGERLREKGKARDRPAGESDAGGVG